MLTSLPNAPTLQIWSFFGVKDLTLPYIFCLSKPNVFEISLWKFRSTLLRNSLRIIIQSCQDDLEKIHIYWNSSDFLDITELIQAIVQCTINLKHLNIPLYTLEQLLLIHRSCNRLRKLEIHIDKRMDPNNPLYVFATEPHESLEKIIIRLYTCKHDVEIDETLLDIIFARIFYRGNRIKSLS